MKKLLVSLLVFLFAIAAQAQKPSSNSTAASATSTGPKKGSLVVVGGGKIPRSISEKFIALAGGPEANIVYIPTAAEDQALNRQTGDESPKLFGLKNVTVLHTRDRNVANTEKFAAPLRKATGVWFGGGRQWRLVDSYLDTLVHKELLAVLERGGVIGGSSAGATIQGSYLVRGAREGNTIMMAKGYEAGLGFLKNTAIDQHINTRKRENDLNEVIAAHPELLGVGLYESTAIVVQGDKFEVIGDGKVAITDGKEHDGKKYYLLSAGERFDLKARARL
ncbi:MAG: Peptidase E [Acidobacteria bacterium]|nr:Peptidase E [Acidobacteriota bacterium]